VLRAAASLKGWELKSGGELLHEASLVETWIRTGRLPEKAKGKNETATAQDRPRQTAAAPGAEKAAADRLDDSRRYQGARVRDRARRELGQARPLSHAQRLGAIVVVPVTLKFGVQMRQTWQGWKGQIEGQVGEMLVWGLDGKRSDAAPLHEHDLVKRHKNQKIGTCAGCGCTDDRACRGGCSWVSPGWCSACVVKSIGVQQ
jgi:hypothetical protein